MDPVNVTVLAPVENEALHQFFSSHSQSTGLSLPQPTFRKELKEMNEKWSLKMARLEALITLSHWHLSLESRHWSIIHLQQVLSEDPFMLSLVPSGQTGPASGLDGI